MERKYMKEMIVSQLSPGQNVNQALGLLFVDK